MAAEFSISILLKLLDEATKPLKDVSKQFKKFGDDMQATGDKFVKTGKKLTLGLTAPIMAFAGIAVKNFGEADEAAARLESALRITGKEGIISSQNLIKFAESLQETTNIEHETTEGTMALLAQMTNLSEKQIMEMIPLIQDWSVAMGVDMSTATNQFVRVLSGSTPSIGRFKVGIKEGMTESQRFATVQDFLKKRVEGTAQSMATRGLGPLKSLKITFDELAEDIGSLLLPFVNSLAAGLKDLINWFSALDAGTKGIIMTVAGILAALGPLTIGLGGLIKTIGLVAGAFSFLAGHPVVLALLAVASAVTMIVLAVNKYNNRFDDAIKKTDDMRLKGKALVSEYTELQKKTNKTVDEQKRMAIIQKQLIADNPKFASSINKITGELNLSSKAQKEYNDMLVARENKAIDAKLADLNNKEKIAEEGIKLAKKKQKESLLDWDKKMYAGLEEDQIKKLENIRFEQKGLLVQKEQLNTTEDTTKATDKKTDSVKDLTIANEKQTDSLKDQIAEEKRIKGLLKESGGAFIAHENRIKTENENINVSKTMESMKSQTEVKVIVEAKNGTEAKIDKVKTKGPVKTATITESYLGYSGYIQKSGAH